MTTNDDVFIREVDEGLSQDRQLAALRRYGPVVVVAFLVMLAVIAFVELREGRRAAARADAAQAYAALSGQAEPGALADFAAAVPADGYRALALMRAAAGQAGTGGVDAAIASYAAVAADEDVTVPLRDLARLRAAYLALGEEPASAERFAQEVETASLRPYASEVAGLAAMRRGDHGAAVAAFAAAQATAAEPGLRARSATFAALAEAAAAGVPLEATADADDFLSQFGEALRSGALDAPAGDAAEADAPPADGRLPDDRVPPEGPTPTEEDE